MFAGMELDRLRDRHEKNMSQMKKFIFTCDTFLIMYGEYRHIVDTFDQLGTPCSN